MKTSLFDYDLDPSYIAQTPIEPRHASRLMVLDRKKNSIEHAKFYQLPKFLNKNDLLVVNRTRVLPARLFAKKTTGGKVELLLLKDLGNYRWEVLIGGTNVKPKTTLLITNGISAVIEDELDGACRIIQFSEEISHHLNTIGEMPLPPYIHQKIENPERYQTIYSQENGSAAAPTAGLHFTQELVDDLQSKYIRICSVLLHIGLDTFAPVKEEEIENHKIHSEWCSLDCKTANLIQETKSRNGKVVSVGTTSVRILETAANQNNNNLIKPFTGMSNLFIVPGFQFKIVDALITNFHLPRSTLLMLVSAFAGRERILNAYQEAIALKYRFYSFGDAMLIL